MTKFLCIRFDLHQRGVLKKHTQPLVCIILVHIDQCRKYKDKNRRYKKNIIRYD